MERACELVELLDAGDVCDGIIDVNNSSGERRKLALEPEWIKRFLGISISEEEMVQILQKLDFEVKDGVVAVPTFRADVEHKADVAEEIARFYGYDRIPATLVGGSAQGKLTEEQKFERMVNDTMQALGYSEIMTYSFISPKFYDKIGLPSDSPLRRSVTIANPLGEDTSIMRTIALPSLCEALSRNYSNRNLSASLYEIATEYIPKESDSELPVEKQSVVIGAYGEGTDFFSLKGAVEALLEKARVFDYDVQPTEEYAFHPGRCAQLLKDGKAFGVIGELHPKVLENYGLGGARLCGGARF